jgi:AAA+ superfamily predicted ATPase
MFLTSNRVSVFDQAVKSRIHMALQYSPPGPETRRLIWRNHLTRVPPSERNMDVEKALDVLCETEMNGREISNAINTARTLAKSEGARLSLEYLNTIVMVWEEFERSLTSIQAAEVGPVVNGKP